MVVRYVVDIVVFIVLLYPVSAPQRVDDVLRFRRGEENLARSVLNEHMLGSMLTVQR